MCANIVIPGREDHMKKSHYATMTKRQNRSMWQAYKDGVH